MKQCRETMSQNAIWRLWNNRYGNGIHKKKNVGKNHLKLKIMRGFCNITRRVLVFFMSCIELQKYMSLTLAKVAMHQHKIRLQASNYCNKCKQQLFYHLNIRYWDYFVVIVGGPCVFGLVVKKGQRDVIIMRGIIA